MGGWVVWWWAKDFDMLRTFADIQDARGHCDLASEHLVWRVLVGGHRLPKILAGTDLILILMCNYQI